MRSIYRPRRSNASAQLYRWHTGFPGGLKERPADDQLVRRPEEVRDTSGIKRMCRFALSVFVALIVAGRLVCFDFQELAGIF